MYFYYSIPTTLTHFVHFITTIQLPLLLPLLHPYNYLSHYSILLLLHKLATSYRLLLWRMTLT